MPTNPPAPAPVLMAWARSPRRFWMPSEQQQRRQPQRQQEQASPLRAVAQPALRLQQQTTTARWTTRCGCWPECGGPGWTSWTLQGAGQRSWWCTGEACLQLRSTSVAAQCALLQQAADRVARAGRCARSSSWRSPLPTWPRARRSTRRSSLSWRQRGAARWPAGQSWTASTPGCRWGCHCDCRHATVCVYCASQVELTLCACAQADGERRKAEAEKAHQDKAEREAKALALVSVGPGFSRRPRPHSALK